MCEQDLREPGASEREDGKRPCVDSLSRPSGPALGQTWACKGPEATCTCPEWGGGSREGAGVGSCPHSWGREMPMAKQVTQDRGPTSQAGRGLLRKEHGPWAGLCSCVPASSALTGLGTAVG